MINRTPGKPYSAPRSAYIRHIPLASVTTESKGLILLADINCSVLFYQYYFLFYYSPSSGGGGGVGMVRIRLRLGQIKMVKLVQVRLGQVRLPQVIELTISELFTVFVLLIFYNIFFSIMCSLLIFLSIHRHGFIGILLYFIVLFPFIT